MITRPECENDYAAIRRLHQEAFPTCTEATLVDQLRADGDATHSQVGIIDGIVAGHAMCSRLVAPFPAIALAPVATHAAYRRQGIAADIINSIVEEATTGDWCGVFVLGNPDYYERFGFSVQLASKFESPYQGEHFMFHPLGTEIANLVFGSVEYPPAFSQIE